MITGPRAVLPGRSSLATVEPAAENQGECLDRDLEGKERFSDQLLRASEGGFGPRVKIVVAGDEDRRCVLVGKGFANF